MEYFCLFINACRGPLTSWPLLLHCACPKQGPGFPSSCHGLFCVYFGDTLKSNDITYGVISGFIFSTNQSVRKLPNLVVLKPSMLWDLLCDWSIFLIVLHNAYYCRLGIWCWMPLWTIFKLYCGDIVWSNMYERLADMTPYRKSLDVCVSRKEYKNKHTTNIFFLIRLRSSVTW